MRNAWSVPCTCKESLLRFSGTSGGKGGSKCKLARVVVAVHFAPGVSIANFAGPGSALGLASTTIHSGEDASTNARSPLMLTRFASTSPRKPPPQTENRSTCDTTGATPAPCSLAPVVGASISAAAESPAALAISTSTSVGTVKNARPVLSVFTRCSFPTSTVIPAARRPSTPRTASVAGCPATSLGGSTIETVHVVAAVDCAGASGAQINRTQPQATHASEIARTISPGFHAAREFWSNGVERNRMYRII